MVKCSSQDFEVKWGSIHIKLIWNLLLYLYNMYVSWNFATCTQHKIHITLFSSEVFGWNSCKFSFHMIFVKIHVRITWISYKIHVTLLRNCSALKMSTAFFRKHMSSLCCLFYFITTSYYILTFYCRMIEDSLRSVFTQFNFFIHNLGQMKFSSHQEGALLSFVPKTYRSVVCLYDLLI